MTTQFFERQEVQRKYTLWLVTGVHCLHPAGRGRHQPRRAVGLGGDPRRVLRQEPAVVFWISAIVFGTILIASWHRSSQLRAGGAVIARALGGVQVNANDGDLKRQRLVNVVEEMAIAARIRKPQVFVLPDEAGINAFAAGNSPDEAAVAVTQGALDALRSRPTAGRHRPRIQSHPQRRHEDQHAPDGMDLRPLRDQRSRAALHEQARRRQRRRAV